MLRVPGRLPDARPGRVAILSLARSRCAPVPFGCRVAKDRKTLEPVPEEQAAIKRMGRLRRQGKSLRAISQDMKGRGHNVSHEGVKRVLARVHERRK